MTSIAPPETEVETTRPLTAEEHAELEHRLAADEPRSPHWIDAPLGGHPTDPFEDFELDAVYSELREAGHWAPGDEQVAAELARQRAEDVALMGSLEWVRATTPGVCDRCDRVYSAGTVLLTDPLGVRCSCTGEPESQRAAVARPSRAVAVA